MIARSSTHGILGAVAFALATAFAVAALAAAVADRANSGVPAAGPAETAAPVGREDSLALHLDVDAHALGIRGSRDVALSAPADAPEATPAPARASRDVSVDARRLGVPAALAIDLGLGVDEGRAPGAVGPTAPLATASRTAVLPAASVPFALAAALAAAIGAVAWAWPTLKDVLGRAVVAPLYAHIGRAEVFENDVRERLFELVKTEPGISPSELSSRLGVSWGTTIYHLDVLEQNRMLVSVKDGRYRRYFENGGAAADRREAVAVLRNAQTAAVAERVSMTPGLSQKDLAHAIGLSPQALHWHAARLLRAGIVTKVREGRVVRFYRSA